MRKRNGRINNVALHLVWQNQTRCLEFTWKLWISKWSLDMRNQIVLKRCNQRVAAAQPCCSMFTSGYFRIDWNGVTQSSTWNHPNRAAYGRRFPCMHWALVCYSSLFPRTVLCLLVRFQFFLVSLVVLLLLFSTAAGNNAVQRVTQVGNCCIS